MAIEIGNIYIVTKGMSKGTHGVITRRVSRGLYMMKTIDGRSLFVGTSEMQPYPAIVK